MPRTTFRDPICYRRRYNPEVIELYVRWCQAVKVTGSWLEKINLDDNVASHRGLACWARRIRGGRADLLA